MKVLLLWIHLLVANTLSTTDKQKTLYIPGIDCRHPRSIRTGLISSICSHQAEPDVPPAMTTLLLQYSTKRIIRAYRCEKRETTIREVCGFSSHSKLFSPPDILAPVEFGPAACKQTVLGGSYVREDGTTIPLPLNSEVRYKYLRHGSLTVTENNVACEGSRVSIDGEIHSSIVEMVSTEVIVKEIDIEIDIGASVDLDSQVDLPRACRQDTTCQIGPISYYIEHPANSCPLYTIRTLPMRPVKILTEDGEKTALLSKQHKLLLPLGDKEAAHSECRPVFSYQATSYPDIKVITEAHAVASVANIATHLSPSILDMDLELRTSEEFLAYMFETTLKQSLSNVGSSICKMGRHGLGNSEISPFHDHSLLRIRGDIVQELTCTPVNAEVRLGEQRGELCSTDTIPVWLNNQPLHLQAENHLILEDAEITAVDCSSTYPPIFMTADNTTLVQASPVVQIIELTLSHLEEDYLHLLKEEKILHTGFEEDILYTHDEIDKFNNLIHFQRTRKRVVNAMVSQYCANNPSCGTYQPGSSASSFSLDNFAKTLESPFAFLGEWEDRLAKIGSYCSIFILLVSCGIIIFRCCHIIYLTCKHKLKLGEAIKLSVFTNHTMIDALLTSTPTPRRSTRMVPTPVEERIPLRTRGKPETSEAGQNSTAVVPYPQHEYSWTT